MKMYQKQTCLLIILMILTPLYNTHAVCDLATLQMELQQDLADNGMLDCLRVIDPPHFVEETEQQKNLRLSAQWDSSCSFESDSNWMEVLSKNFGINQLVDAIGDPVNKDFKDQADMCEIVRAAVAKGKFKIKDLNMQNIPAEALIKGIDCVGTLDKRGTRICAATGVSFYQKDSWAIFLTSSFIKFGNIPKFVKSKPKEKRRPLERSSTDNLLKTLLKMGRKGLLKNEAKVAKMIDKEVSQEQEPEHQQEKSRVVHVHVKRTSRTGISQKGDFAPLQGANFKYKLDESRLIFSFYMISFKLNKPGIISTKLSFNGREVGETRQTLGLVTDGSITSAFAEVYNPNGKGVQLGVLYESSSDGIINSSTHDHNLSYGSITLPVGPVFKHINSRTLVFIKTESWVNLASFSLHVDAPKEAFYLIFYNFSIKLKSKSTLYTRLIIDTKQIKETSTATGAVERVGNHCARVVKLSQGRHNLNIEYKYDGDQGITLNDFTDPRYVQSLVAFELPPNTLVKNYNLDRSITLDTLGGFKPFGFNVNVNIDREKTILIIYNVNLKSNGNFFSVRIRMGNKFNRKSIISTKNLEYGRGIGYVVRVLKKGSYTFDLDYRTDSKESYNPDTADSQTVSMQIIEMD